MRRCLKCARCKLWIKARAAHLEVMAKAAPDEKALLREEWLKLQTVDLACRVR